MQMAFDSMHIDSQIGQRLRALRLARGLSQADLASKVNLSFQQIQKYESGNSRMTASKLYEISVALDISVVWFFENLPLTSEDIKNYEPDAVLQNDAWKVASEFNCIQDKTTRKKILELVKCLSDSEVGGI